MNNHSILAQLRHLAGLPETRFPFLSVYLDARNDGPERHGEARIFLKNAIRDAGTVIYARDERESFEKDVAQITRFLDEESHRDPDVRGFAIFACAADGVFEAIRSKRPFQSQFLVGGRPLVRQLAVALDEYQPVAAVVVDSRAARIFEISDVGDVVETDMTSDIARGHKAPEYRGFGELKYQREVRGQVEHHWQEVGAFLEKLVDRGFRRFVLLGQESVVQNFRKAVPRRVDERVVGTGHMDRREARDRVVAAAMTIVRAEEERAAKALVVLIRDQALSGNLGVFGLEATLGALRKGQVHRIAISDDLKARGWRCHGCTALVTHLRNDACPYCTGGVDVVELGDEIVKDAVAQGAEIEMLRPSDELARMGKIGALLRYRD
jgi:hypothetical protein